ncbi:MAG: hypothetical protein CVU68_00635 [Deltaproteobacteria bacterium HGW-Deltaproteobacteria-3]|nr:MAG: hypothetical protein CVU68_00635 [Deltaproteobacteria bacterium HGW-Deltaproteobacteria-3]
MNLERRKYDPDFKRNAVRLSEEPGRTATEVAEHLGITKDLLCGVNDLVSIISDRHQTGSDKKAFCESTSPTGMDIYK